MNRPWVLALCLNFRLYGTFQCSPTPVCHGILSNHCFPLLSLRIMLPIHSDHVVLRECLSPFTAD